ncbi:MAG TPA: FHA domain-containing protein [Kofleriaceae bacterium]|nr:FHA domain-containing protein [Kofleriaceae bacterium]
MWSAARVNGGAVLALVLGVICLGGLGGLGGFGGAARADDAAPPTYRAVVDRADLEPASIGGTRLTVELSALDLYGKLLDLSDPKSIRLMVGGSKLDAPYARGAYGATSSETAIVFVIQANLAYAEALPTIATALDDVLTKLPDRTQAAIMAYGDATEAGKLGSLKAARSRLTQLAQDGSASEPALLDTLDRAVRLLRKARPSREGAALRRLIVVIGDGRDRSNDRDRVTKLGANSGKTGIRIHTFGFAPSNVRRPLLTLGELSRQSLGTFRWVRTGGAESWTPALQQLRDEINKQAVLTYFLPADTDVAGKKLKVVLIGRTEATSNETKLGDVRCGADACAGYCVDGTCVIPRGSSGRGVVGWLILVVGVGLGAAVVLGLIGFVLQRRQVGPPGFVPGQRSPAWPAGPGMPPAPGTPGIDPRLAAAPGAAGAPAAVPPGAALPGAPPPARSSWWSKRSKAAPLPVAAPAPPANGPALLLLTGPRAGQRIPLLNGFTIGKAPTSNLVLEDGYTSTHHAQVGMDQFGNCRLYDRNSTNGTFVNGVRVTEVVLDHGMSVRIGSTELRFLAQ